MCILNPGQVEIDSKPPAVCLGNVSPDFFFYRLLFSYIASYFKNHVANREQYKIVDFEGNIVGNISLQVLLCFPRVRKTISYKTQADQRHQRGKPESQTRPNVYEFNIASTFYLFYFIFFIIILFIIILFIIILFILFLIYFFSFFKIYYYFIFYLFNFSSYFISSAVSRDLDQELFGSKRRKIRKIFIRLG